jgi:peptidoglycan/LPS O-acetylase OafA/YrhL
VARQTHADAVAIVTAPAVTSAGPPRSGASHLAHVEGLRALAAYVVFINHAYAQVWNPARGQFPPAYLSPFTYSLVFGHLAVTVFIVVSGFCLMLPVIGANNHLRGGALGFFKRRARRILPPYYAAVAFCLLAIWTIIGNPTGTLWDVPIQVNKVAIISHLLLVQDLFGTSRINYVFWSIAVEWQIYFLFPLLVWSWRRYGPGITVSIALFLGYALRIGFDHTRATRANPQYLGLFALGMLAAYLVRSDHPHVLRLRTRVPWGTLAIACVALVCVLSGVWKWELAVTRYYVFDLPIAVAAMCILVLTSQSETNVARRLLSSRGLVFIGRFSYSVYLIHAPILQILWQYVMHPTGLAGAPMFAAMMLPGAFVVLAASYAFFKVFEEPFLNQAKARPAPQGAADVFEPQRV